ncbi:MAG: ABC transporter permease subunit [Eubacterium sp.]
MLNVIKMDFYRMLKTKSLYIVWIILALVTVFTTYLSAEEFYDTEVQQESSQKLQDTSPDNMNLGITVTLPTEASEKVTVYDIIFANIQGKAIGIFIAIFAVIFSTADMNSGYIKNIGGQVARRSRLVWSKEISLFLFTILTIGIYIMVQMISNQIFFGYLKFGDVGALIRYLLVEVLLHFTLALICMAIAMLIRNNVVSMIIAICLCMNVLMILYSAIDNLLKNIAPKNFHIINYTVTGKISQMSMDFTNKEGAAALVVGLIFIIVMSIVSSVMFEKRDIV